MLYNNCPLKFHSKEYSAMVNWRCDLLCYIETDDVLYPKRKYKQAVYTEVKYNNNARDLINELSKGLYYINTRGTKEYPRSLCVISDNTLDQVTIDFIKTNHILHYVYTIENDDLSTLKINKINY